MHHVRISKVIGLIGLFTAFLLLCPGESFEPAPKLYRAKPEDVPSWAEQGNFRFIRLDGGQIESWKAERTWWGRKFSAEEKDVLAHIYDREKVLCLHRSRRVYLLCPGGKYFSSFCAPLLSLSWFFSGFLLGSMAC